MTCCYCQGEIHPDQGVLHMGTVVAHRSRETCTEILLARSCQPAVATERARCSEVERLASLVVARVLKVYSAEYIVECVQKEPDSLLGLVKNLESALSAAAMERGEG